jgi:pyruvate formate lyase activating enzyme
MKINMGSILDMSTLDYPGKICTVIYLYGCSFKCPWCHNPELVEGDQFEEVEIDKLIEIIKKNYLINAVSITGGEPTLQTSTIELLKGIKEKTDLKLKIDTNCSFPEALEKALPYLDAISTDIKGPFEKYSKITGVDIDINKVKKSHELLKNWDKPKEARTTIIPGLNENIDDVKKVCEIVKNVGFDRFVLQQFRSLKTLDKKYEDVDTPSYEKIKELGTIAKECLPDVEVVVATDRNGFEII